ncbi:hypothetical protein KGF86_01940 [Ornithinibacillus massiliensis]|uniref:Uncharacterized protein n=1 Tax=Ornithinibacillus massiliensis TaxID=1944633 RepID=A0ABS5MB04_9BACI|nr:hypothetical protein [Ornithinibacillus massiliensis]MBS3678963.1 hypothetical protein [Ornithinibacillus massiliensis]
MGKLNVSYRIGNLSFTALDKLEDEHNRLVSQYLREWGRKMYNNATDHLLHHEYKLDTDIVKIKITINKGDSNI